VVVEKTLRYRYGFLTTTIKLENYLSIIDAKSQIHRGEKKRVLNKEDLGTSIKIQLSNIRRKGYENKGVTAQLNAPVVYPPQEGAQVGCASMKCSRGAQVDFATVK